MGRAMLFVVWLLYQESEQRVLTLMVPLCYGLSLVEESSPRKAVLWRASCHNSAAHCVCSQPVLVGRKHPNCRIRDHVCLCTLAGFRSEIVIFSLISTIFKASRRPTSPRGNEKVSTWTKNQTKTGK